MGELSPKVKAAFYFLKEKAQQGELPKYKEVADHLGIHIVQVRKVLWPIESYRVKRNWPPITAIVVSVKSGMPEVDFLNYLFQGMPEDRIASEWEKTVKEVFSYDWENTEL